MSGATFVVRTHWYHPEWCAVALAASAWVVLTWLALADPVRFFGSPEVHPPLHAFGHAAVMVTAMMVPFVLPQVAFVAQSSLWSRRYRAAAGYLVGYLAVWTAVATASVVLGGLLVTFVGWRPAIVVGFAVAAAAYAAPSRRRLLRQCAMTMPLAVSGWRADRDCVRYGVATARRCVATCCVLMTAVMIGHGLVVMAAATVLGVLERRRGRNVARGDGTLVVVALGLLTLALSYGVGGGDPSSPTVPLEPHAH
ncbi:DUF2182 domain-containing protein [Mumia sp. zg.B53]|uniref:copper chaperone n=1 Tax=unclassified Mumia TaxID=2621872 RepID=UPI001C6E4A26|nr:MULTISPECIES: DUF2182 domain-containing protein [unclassified Mumia]MBW9211609.1 DUF2182 domain-containing protein [Mumia sp. zg.B21]MBW9216780.1 DUF2182 domain-containing protein [Mumia sp. zg.B53]